MPYNWVAGTHNSPVPSNAVHAGNDKGGSPYYVGRANHENETMTVKISPNLKSAWIPYFGKEISITHFEFLTGSGFSWENSYTGQVPNSAVTTGNAGSEQIYVGRAHLFGHVLPGKVVPSQGSIYVSYGGKEYPVKEFEYLICH